MREGLENTLKVYTWAIGLIVAYKIEILKINNNIIK